MKRAALLIMLIFVSCATQDGMDRVSYGTEPSRESTPTAQNKPEAKTPETSIEKPDPSESLSEELAESREMEEVQNEKEKPETEEFSPSEESVLSFEISPSAPPKELPEVTATMAAGKRIVIDPGHGGSDPGAIAGNWTEKYLNGRVAYFLGELLTQAGFHVRYTRPPLNMNRTLELNERVEEINRIPYDLMLSIHHNAAHSREPQGFSLLYSSYRPLNDTHGIDLITGGRIHPWIREEIRDNETYMYYKDGDLVREIHGNHVYNVVDRTPGIEAQQSLKFAEHLYRSLRELDHLEPQYMSGRDRPIVAKENRVIRLVPGAAVIVECGFMTNPRELSRLVLEENQRATAESLFYGIIAYLEEL